jgi:hypothetical protein
MSHRGAGILLLFVAVSALVFAVTARPVSRLAFGVASVCLVLALYLFFR